MAYKDEFEKRAKGGNFKNFQYHLALTPSYGGTDPIAVSRKEL